MSRRGLFPLALNFLHELARKRLRAEAARAEAAKVEVAKAKAAA